MHENVVLQNVFGTIDLEELEEAFDRGTFVLSNARFQDLLIFDGELIKSTYPTLLSRLLWAIAALFLGVYNIAQNINVSLIVQPQTFGVLCAFCWCLYYGSARSLRNCAIIFIGYILLAAAFQCCFVFALRVSVNHHLRGAQGGVQFFGIASAIVISSGLFPQYWEIYKFREVVGVSYIFMTIDLLGGVFSLLSLAFKAKWNVVASITYALVVFLDALVLLAALILNPLARRRRREQDKEPQNVDSEKVVATNPREVIPHEPCNVTSQPCCRSSEAPQSRTEDLEGASL